MNNSNIVSLKQDDVFTLSLEYRNDSFSASDNIVLLTFDDGYINQAMNLIASIYKYHRDGVSVICLCPSISDASINILKSNSIGVEVLRCSVNVEINTGRWPIATALRLFIPWFFQDISRVLYLDCDIICSGNLEHLFEVDVPYIAMCSEISGNVGRSQNKKFRPNFPTEIYCNAGVAVFNLDSIRASVDFNNVLESFIDISSSYDYFDQDFLNVFFNKKITYMNNLHYNFQAYELIGTKYFDRASQQCKLIHFSVGKPWNKKTDKRLIKLYLQHSEYPPMIAICNKALTQNRLRSPYTFTRKQLSKLKWAIIGALK